MSRLRITLPARDDRRAKRGTYGAAHSSDHPLMKNRDFSREALLGLNPSRCTEKGGRFSRKREGLDSEDYPALQNTPPFDCAYAHTVIMKSPRGAGRLPCSVGVQRSSADLRRRCPAARWPMQTPPRSE